MSYMRQEHSRATNSTLIPNDTHCFLSRQNYVYINTTFCLSEQNPDLIASTPIPIAAIYWNGHS